MNLRTLAVAAVCVIPAAPLLLSFPLARAETALALPGDTTPAPDTLVVGEPASSYAWTARTAEFRQDLPITAGNRGDSVEVEAPPLRGPGGEEVKVRAWFGDDTLRTRVRIAGLRSTVLHLSARLGAPGEYRGRFALIATGRRTDKGYTVTLAKAAAPIVVVHGSDASASTLGPFSWLGGADRVVIPLTLVDSVAPARVALPQLETLQRYVGADTAMQVDFGKVKVLGQDDSVMTDSVSLGQGDSRRVRLYVSGIRAAGAYTGVVRILAAGADPRLATVKVYVRRSAWVALFLILAGVGISWAIREYQLGLRPRLLRQRRAAELLEWLAATERQVSSTGGATPDETRVLAAQRTELDRIYDGQTAPAAAGGGGDAAAAPDDDARLKLVAARLEVVPDWVNARRQVDAIPAGDVAEAARTDLQRKLDDIREALLTGTAEEVKKAATTAHGIPGDIRTALKERLEKEIADFGAEVAKERAAHPTKDPTLIALEDEVAKKLERAKELAGAERLAEARAEYEAARTAYGNLLRVLATELAKAAGEAEANRPVTEDQKARLDAIVAAAQSVVARLAGDNLNGAAAAYTEAQAEWAALLPTLPPVPAAGRLGGSEAQPSPPANPLGSAAALGFAPGIRAAEIAARMVEAAPIRRASSAELTAAVRRWDRLLSLAVAVITTALGMWLLWIGHLVWGSAGDMFAAFLWGLGLHQAGTSGAARGSTGVLQSIVGKPGGES